jgi:hypothetical protein
MPQNTLIEKTTGYTAQTRRLLMRERGRQNDAEVVWSTTATKKYWGQQLYENKQVRMDQWLY